LGQPAQTGRQATDRAIVPHACVARAAQAARTADAAR
jgi:hypothetical protein